MEHELSQVLASESQNLGISQVKQLLLNPPKQVKHVILQIVHYLGSTSFL